MKKRIAIIPARAGSKRIPEKNIRYFCGKPMISYVLQAAKASGLFDVIHVSTESSKVKDAVESLGFKIDFLRPAELAQDDTPIMPVLKYVADQYAAQGKQFDEVWMLMACSPLLEKQDLIAAADILSSSGSKNAVMAVTEYPSPIEWALKRNKDGALIPVQQGMFAIRSQDLEKKYFDAGVFVAYPSQVLKSSEGAGSDEGKLGIIYPKEKAIDIDDESDWKIAEALYKVRNPQS